MGLDISYVARLQRVECADPDNCDHEQIYLAPGFSGREAPLTPGCYVSEGEGGGGFRAGSYGGYNAWRDKLARLAGVPSSRFAPYGGEGIESAAATVWNAPEQYASTPFVELVNFSDCEGTIGPNVARKLAADFAAHDARAKAEWDEYSYGKYCEWRRAFEVAADGGAVLFH